MSIHTNVLVRGPNAEGWPWKSASPQVFWRVHIGRRIKERREQIPSDMPTSKSVAMSQEALARHLGIASFNIWEMENGIVGVDAALLARLAEVLHVHPGWFFDFEPLPRWIETLERSRFLHRLNSMLSSISSGEFDIIETVFRFLAKRQIARTEAQ